MPRPTYFTTSVQTTLRCLRCGHEWVPRKKVGLPVSCANPKCRSVAWKTSPKKKRVR